MANQGGIGNAYPLLKRTILGVFHFSGRSRRTEMFCYHIAAGLFSSFGSYAAVTLFSLEDSFLTDLVFSLIVAIPAFALFIRRLHDQDRSGRWGLLWVVALIAAAWGWMEVMRTGVPPPRFGSLNHTPWWFSLPLVLTILALLWLPGTDGPNRYGEDPRLSE